MPHSTGRRAPQQRAAHRRRHSHAIATPAGSSALERALLAALQLRRPLVLERLAEQAGAAAFARALMRLSTRQMMDALSLLPQQQRTAVWARLSPAARRRWGRLATQATASARPGAAAPDATDMQHLRLHLSGILVGALGQLRHLLAAALPRLGASTASTASASS